MSGEISFILESDKGKVTVESSDLSLEISNELKSNLGKSVSVNCGRPQVLGDLDFECGKEVELVKENSNDVGNSIYLFRLYHYSTVDGPGRRTVVQFAGCSIRCVGCYVPETHDRVNGELTAIREVVSEIVKRRDEHDGVTILGGEPFDQVDGLGRLVAELKRLRFHIVIYSGYKLEDLLKREDGNFRRVLKDTDLLIDGAFERELVQNVGEYRGSANQRLIWKPFVT